MTDKSLSQVVISGASGFIGSHLTRHLIESGVAVTAIDLPNRRDRLPDEVAYIPCNLADAMTSDLSQLPQNPDAFFHLAWHGVDPESRNNYEIQVENISHCLTALRIAANCQAKRFLLPGSTFEYQYNDALINAQSLPTPMNAYAAAKVAARYLCTTLAKDLQIPLLYAVITSVYGVGREDSNVVFYTIDCLLHGIKPSLTPLQQRWDFISIDDVVPALIAIAERGHDNAFYAVGRGDNLPLCEFLKIIRDLIDPALELGIGELAYSDDKIPCSAVDVLPLEQDTGFRAKKSFAEGMSELIAHYRRKPL